MATRACSPTPSTPIAGSWGTAQEIPHPFLWMPGVGLSPLPTLGGTQGQPPDLNEFGQIAGASITAAGEIRAALWIPTAGPLVVAPPDVDAASETR